MSDGDFWECHNCGSTDLVEIEWNKHQCTYCGTVLAVRNQVFSEKPGFSDAIVKCPRCGFDNERGDRYCNNCGKVLVIWAPVVVESKKMDPAILSIIVSVVGWFVIPFGGPVVGLILGYKALRDARDGGRGEKSERRAKIAIVGGRPSCSRDIPSARDCWMNCSTWCRVAGKRLPIITFEEGYDERF